MKTFVSVALAASLVASSAMAQTSGLTEFVGTNDSSAAVQFFEDATGGRLFGPRRGDFSRRFRGPRKRLGVPDRRTHSPAVEDR